MSDQKNPLGVNRELPADFFDQSAQETNVINVGIPLIATRIGGGPELVACGVNGAVRVTVKGNFGLPLEVETASNSLAVPRSRYIRAGGL